MSKLGWFPFYPRDWYADPKLITTSPGTRGIWIDLLCVMFVEGGSSVTGDRLSLARLARCLPDDIDQFLNECRRTKFADLAETFEHVFTITSRRFKRDQLPRVKNRDRQRRFREKGGGDPERWTAIRVHILERDGYTCAYCSRKGTTVDHIQPRSKGGGEDAWNLVACCKRCNGAKNDRTLLESGLTLRPDVLHLLTSLNGSRILEILDYNGSVTASVAKPRQLVTLSDSDSRSNSGSGSQKKSEESTDLRFEEFYSAYPRKKKKPAALKAWRELSPSDTLAAEITADVKVRFQHRDLSVTPYPASYLHGREWEDPFDEAPLFRNGHSPNDDRPTPPPASEVLKRLHGGGS